MGLEFRKLLVPASFLAFCPKPLAAELCKSKHASLTLNPKPDAGRHVRFQVRLGGGRGSGFLHKACQP